MSEVNEIVIHIISSEITKKTLREWSESFREDLLSKAERLKKSLEITIGTHHEKGRF